MKGNMAKAAGLFNAPASQMAAWRRSLEKKPAVAEAAAPAAAGTETAPEAEAAADAAE